MKLVIAIVQDEDAPALTDALVAAGHRFTKVSTTGSFLRTGNTSLLIGVADDLVPNVIGILRRTCRRRTQVTVPYSPALEPGLLHMPENFEVEVGGAVLLIIHLGRFEPFLFKRHTGGRGPRMERGFWFFTEGGGGSLWGRVDGERERRSGRDCR